MTREEMLELAVLDAAGLLDTYESALYTRSFHHAPAAVQDEVRELQARIAADETLMPDLEPPAELRDRVLASVSKAIEQEADHSPIATIGRPQRPHAIAGRIGNQPSGSMWRAASFIMLASVIVLGYFLTQATSNVSDLVSVMQSDNVRRISEELGPSFDDYLVDPNSDRIVLTPTTGDEDAGATLFLNENDAFLYINELQACVNNDECYTLTVVEDDGTRHDVASFTSTGNSGGLQIASLPAAAIRGATFEILSAAGAVVLRSV